MEPKPFDTAPTDGTEVLVYDGERWIYAFNNNGVWYGDHGSYQLGNPLYEEDLTHWMPQLPKPQDEQRVINGD